MSGDKLKKLEKYLAHVKERLASPIPPKHNESVESLMFYLNKELTETQRKIDALKLAK